MNAQESSRGPRPAAVGDRPFSGNVRQRPRESYPDLSPATSLRHKEVPNRHTSDGTGSGLRPAELWPAWTDNFFWADTEGQAPCQKKGGVMGRPDDAPAGTPVPHQIPDDPRVSAGGAR
jgi:hypothetical protein